MKEKILLLAIIFIALFLRIYKVDTIPPGLYQDEAAIGYNAYTILQKGTDEYGIKTPIFFKSFGDYKLPVYIYTTSASIAVFGRNDFAVRFPSIALGTLTVLVLYLFLKSLFQLDNNFDKLYKQKIPLLAAFLLAILPWSIHFSRGGFEANMALFLFMFGNLLLIYFLRNKKIIFLLGFSILMVSSIYTYHSYRIIAPLTFLLSIIYIFWKMPKERKKIYLSFLTFSLLSFPIFIYSFSTQGSERFSSTSAFAELHVKTIYEKLISYPALFIKNYLSYFSFYFLFDHGDGIGRHQIANFGPLFKWQLPFLISGIYFLVRAKRESLIKNFIFILLLISPIAASFAAPSPHTLRSLSMSIPIVVLISFGILFIFQKLGKFAKPFMILLCMIVIYEFFLYAHFYYVHYPQLNALDWGGGYAETVAKAQELSPKFDEIIVDKNLDFAPIYLHFYEPNLVFKRVDVTWAKGESDKNKRILYIRPFYGEKEARGIIYSVHLKNKTGDIFSQFWSI